MAHSALGATVMMSFESFVRLGTAFVRVMAKKLLGLRPQLPTFVSYYQPDGIVLFEPSDGEVLTGASRCIACGRCDATALCEGTFTALGPRGPMAFVLGVSRHSGEHDEAEISPEATPAVLARLREACPVDVPFAPLVALVRRRAERLEAARGCVTAIVATD